MKTRSEIVAVEVRLLEGEVGVAVRAVDDHLNASRTADLTDFLYGKDLAGTVGDVANHDDFRARRNRPLDAAGQVIQTRRGRRERNRLEDDPLPAFALPPSRRSARLGIHRRRERDGRG